MICQLRWRDAQSPIKADRRQWALVVHRPPTHGASPPVLGLCDRMRRVPAVVGPGVGRPSGRRSTGPFAQPGRGEVTAGGRRVDRQRPATGAASCRHASRSAASKRLLPAESTVRRLLTYLRPPAWADRGTQPHRGCAGHADPCRPRLRERRRRLPPPGQETGRRRLTGAQRTYSKVICSIHGDPPDGSPSNRYELGEVEEIGVLTDQNSEISLGSGGLLPS